MEKISQIVRGNARINTVDLKSSSAVRPGVAGFGRPTAESSAPGDRVTTASRAASLQQQMAEQRRSGEDRLVEDLANDFFVSKVPLKDSVMEPTSPRGPLHTMEGPPEGFQPRGGLLNIHA